MFEIKDKSELTIKEVSFLLVSFLRKKGLLEEFCEEYYTYRRKCMHKTPKELINKICEEACQDGEIDTIIEYSDYSFLWEKSRKGHAFWRDISWEWKKYLDGKYFTENGR